jgi:putative Ig domain-containing protein
MAWLLPALLLAGLGWAQEENPQKPPGATPLAIVTDTLPQPVAHTPYSVQLVARGGTPPYTWSIEKGKLVPGLRLDAKAGTLSGVPEAPAEFAFTVRITDSADPPATAVRELKVKAVPALQLEWQRHPVLEDDGIYGEVKVANPSKDPYDLTFIIVAINEIGKAFALGYQHFTLRPQATQAIPFGTSLPLGSYIIHADAVGEIAAKAIIRRAQLQTPKPLVKQ